MSEEHETQPVDFSRIPDIDKHLPEVEELIKTDQSIPLNQVIVWIDPLDATQEYTEEFDAGIKISQFLKKTPNYVLLFICCCYCFQIKYHIYPNFLDRQA